MFIYHLEANDPTFTKVAYQLSESEKRTYRIVLSEYFCKSLFEHSIHFKRTRKSKPSSLLDKLFKWLNLNLKNKAENYEDPYLKCIFLLNNAYKISKLFVAEPGGGGGFAGNSPMVRNRSAPQIQAKCKNLNELYAIAGKLDMRAFYDNEILNYKREYSKWYATFYLKPEMYNA